MKKKILVFAFILLPYSVMFGQQIHIKKVTLYRVITKINSEGWEEGQEEGPSVSFDLEILNNTDSVIRLDASNSQINILFRCNDRNYNITPCSIYVMKFYGKKNIEIKPKDKCILGFGESILLGTGLLKYKAQHERFDYTKEMLEILPTLQIQYVDPKFNIVSGKIENVDAKYYYYTVGSHRGK